MPIGNPLDISLRALHIVRGCSVVAAEHPRVTRALLQQYGLQIDPMRYQTEIIPLLLQLIKQGQSVAFVCDAGTPGLADPGALLVRAAIQHNLQVQTVPGPCAALAALSLSGFSAQRFVFLGFPPRRAADRMLFFREAAAYQVTVAVYETSRALHATLRDFARNVGENRPIALASRLTTPQQRIWRGTLAEALQQAGSLCKHGPHTLIVQAPDAQKPARNGEIL